MRRKNFVQPSPKVEAYLRGLNLSERAEPRERDDNLKAPPAKRSKTYLIVVNKLFISQ